MDYNHLARVGAELVTYAFGLGQTNPLVKSETVTPSPAPQLPASQFGLNFNYTPNAGPSLPNVLGSPWFDYTPPSPVYVALVLGFVGLYQVNFVVPPAPAEAYQGLPPGPAFKFVLVFIVVLVISAFDKPQNLSKLQFRAGLPLPLGF